MSGEWVWFFIWAAGIILWGIGYSRDYPLVLISGVILQWFGIGVSFL